MKRNVLTSDVTPAAGANPIVTSVIPVYSYEARVRVAVVERLA